MPCRKAVQWLGKIDKARDGPCFWPSQALSGRLSGLHYTVVGEPLVLQCPFPFLLLSSRAAGFNFSRDPWTYLLESPESHLVTHMRSSLYGSEFPDKQLFIVSCHGVFLVAPWCNMIWRSAYYQYQISKFLHALWAKYTVLMVHIICIYSLLGNPFWAHQL